jgi:Ser/Thr protein kinase RdoA (MazF antagonist)
VDHTGLQALTAKKKLKKPNALGRIVGAIDAAGRDADLARRSSSDPAFRRGVKDDRRATLSKFSTVKHAIADRDRIEKAKKKT